jgi:hypothetical protein
VIKAYKHANFREGRKEDGSLSLLGIEDRLKVLKGLPVFNIVTQTIEHF